MADFLLIIILGLISITLGSINYKLGRILLALTTILNIDTYGLMFARKRGAEHGHRYPFSKN